MSDDAPKTIWRTILGRASFGFYVEASRNQYFLNDDYLQKLCDVENGLAVRYGKLVQTSFLLSLFSLAAAYGVLGDFDLRGFTLAKVPFLLEFCILAMGTSVMLQIILFLDILAVGRMRAELFSTTGSEVPNMRMVHMKGNNAWIDAVTPKFIGYSSGFVHRAVATICLVWSLSLPFAFLSITIAAQVVCFLAVETASYGVFSKIVAWSGLVFSGLSIFVFVVTVFLPLPFKIREFPVEDLPEEAFNNPEEAVEHTGSG